MRTSALFFAILLMVAGALGQSGRKVAPTPTPEPTVVEDPTTYSESTPQKKRPIAVWPSLRGDSQSRSTATTTTASKPAGDVPPAISAGDDDVVKVETNLITIPVSV